MIEDIDHLVANSENDYLTIFYDSASRDKEIYPNPAEYIIDFNEPLKNVYGLEFIDASIPASMYTIDYHNDVLAFSRIFTALDSATFQTWFNKFQDIPIFQEIFNSSKDANIFVILNNLNNVVDTFTWYEENSQVGPIQDINDLSTFGTIKKTFTKSSTPTSNLVMGLFNVTLPSLRLILPEERKENYKYYEANGNTYEVSTIGESFIIEEIYRLHLNFSLSLFDDGGGYVSYFDYFYIDDDNAKKLIERYVAQITGNTSIDIYFANTVLKLERGYYDIISLQNYLQTIFNLNALNNDGLLNSKITISQNTTFGSITKQMKYKFTFKGFDGLNNSSQKRGTGILLFDMKKSTCNQELGFISYPSSKTNDAYVHLQCPWNRQLFISKQGKDALGNDEQYIVTPDVITLLGDRYILLRCPEIESQMFKSFAGSFLSPGVALLKILAVGGVQQISFNFQNTIKKPFHPIGKLSRLTFRFERKNGELYDFKGVDHTVMFNIKFYAPKTVQRNASSLLNPNYNPDYLKYLSDTLSLNTQDMNKNPTNVKETYRQLMLEQNKYDYDDEETDESEYYEDDEEDD